MIFSSDFTNLLSQDFDFSLERVNVHYILINSNLYDNIS